MTHYHKVGQFVYNKVGQFVVITKWDDFITKWDSFSLLQSGTILLQSGTAFGYYIVEQTLLQSGTTFVITKWDDFITKWDGYYKVGQFYYKVGQVLQSGTIITKWALTKAIHKNQIRKQYTLKKKNCILNCINNWFFKFFNFRSRIGDSDWLTFTFNYS